MCFDLVNRAPVLGGAEEGDGRDVVVLAHVPGAWIVENVENRAGIEARGRDVAGDPVGAFALLDKPA